MKNDIEARDEINHIEDIMKHMDEINPIEHYHRSARYMNRKNMNIYMRLTMTYLAISLPMLANSSHPCTPCTQQYSHMNISNKHMKTVHGNITQGSNGTKGIKLLTWNKANSHLINTIEVIKQLIEDEQPMVLAIHEANILQNHDLDKLQIDGFTLYNDGLYKNGKTGRNCLYIDNCLKVQLREYLMDENLALTAVTLGKPNQTKFTILSFYRQWKLLDLDQISGNISRTPLKQAERFDKMTSIWARAIDEGREVISMSDTNLTTQILLDDQLSQPTDQHLKCVSQHFTDKILPRGVYITNKQPTHFSQYSQPTMLDHIMTTHPIYITQVTTRLHSESDHRYITAVRTTKKVVKLPRYKISRNYRKMNIYHFRAILFSSPLIYEATFSREVDKIAQNLTKSVLEALNITAPSKRIQIKNRTFDFRRPDTKELITIRNRLQMSAHTDNLPESWR